MARGPPPNLNVQQQMLLDLVAEMWRASNLWPKRKQLRFKLEKQNVDFDTLYKSFPAGLLADYENTNEENARVRLTVAGLEGARDGAADTAPLSHFVLTGVQRYLAARGPITLSTREEGLLADRPSNERERILELFKLDWTGGYTPEAGGDWRTEITFAHLRFSEVHTAWEYLERQWEGAAHINELSTQHVSLLAEMHALRRASGSWPLAREFILAHENPWQVFRWLEEIASIEKPRLLNRFSPAENEQWNTRLRMTIDAVAIIAPIEADDFARLLHALAHFYAETEGQEDVRPEEMAERMGLSLERLNDLQELFENQHETGVSFSRRPDGSWAFGLRAQVATWRSCSTFAEYRAGATSLPTRQRCSSSSEPHSSRLAGDKHVGSSCRKVTGTSTSPRFSEKVGWRLSTRAMTQVAGLSPSNVSLGMVCAS